MGAYIINVPSTVDRIIYVNVHPMNGKTYTASYSVENLTPYTELDLEQIRKEAWEAAKKICLPAECGGIPADALYQMFNNKSINDIFKKVSASEAVEKIRQYEQKQEEQIHVGDEVITTSGKAVVIGVGPVHFEYFYAGGSGYDAVKYAKKTGRHFPEIASILAKMREESNG